VVPAGGDPEGTAAAGEALSADRRRRVLIATAIVLLGGAAVTGVGLWRPGLLSSTAARLPRAAPVARVSVAAPAVAPVVRISLSERLPARLPVPGIPAGWHLKEFAGQADVELLRDEMLALRLRSRRASYVLYRDVSIDVRTSPWLSWAWKVVQLPSGGDVRTSGSNDQAAQLYVVFPRWPDPRQNSDVIGYVWDTTAPVDLHAANTQAANVRVIVVASGPARLGGWRRFERNIAQDYAGLFGRQPPQAGKVAVMIDSDDTRSDAEALVADIQLSRAPIERRESPTSMLR